MYQFVGKEVPFLILAGLALLDGGESRHAPLNIHAAFRVAEHWSIPHGQFQWQNLIDAA